MNPRKKRFIGLKIFLFALLLAWGYGEIWVYREVKRNIDIDRYKLLYDRAFDCPTEKEYDFGDTFLWFAVNCCLFSNESERRQFLSLSGTIEYISGYHESVEKSQGSFQTQPLWKADIVNFYLLEEACIEGMRQKLSTLRPEIPGFKDFLEECCVD